MAGHSKWSKVKRFKGALDAKRGKIFSKFSKEITVAARMGGGDSSMNPRLRSAVLAARAQNMPNDNIERAIKRGTGEIQGQQIEELVYEGYAPGGVALIVEVATDNKNRTAADLRGIFARHHGHLASTGSVSYMFHKKGQITVPRAAADEDRVLEAALEAGAEELNNDEEHFVITTPFDRLYAVGDALKKAGLNADSVKPTYLPESFMPIHDPTVASHVTELCEELEENDDVQHVYANCEFPDQLLSKLTH
jgi:YebC/PmpR family DNA-binding regulatory protein